VGQRTGAGGYIGGIDGLASLGTSNLVLAVAPAAPATLLLATFLFAALFLALFFCPHRKRRVDLGCCCDTELLLKFLDALLGLGELLCRRLELTLNANEQIDEADGIDSTLSYIVLELFDGVHAESLSSRLARSCASLSGFLRVAPSHLRQAAVAEWTATAFLA
jgi:hypothetical protein